MLSGTHCHPLIYCCCCFDRFWLILIISLLSNGLLLTVLIYLISNSHFYMSLRPNLNLCHHHFRIDLSWASCSRPHSMPHDWLTAKRNPWQSYHLRFPRFEKHGYHVGYLVKQILRRKTDNLKTTSCQIIFILRFTVHRAATIPFIVFTLLNSNYLLSFIVIHSILDFISAILQRLLIDGVYVTIPFYLP